MKFRGRHHVLRHYQNMKESARRDMLIAESDIKYKAAKKTFSLYDKLIKDLHR